MKQHVRVAVIGGGVTGCSVLYHLAKAGWTDVALFERSELTSGSSWHAAGGTSAFAADANMGFLQKYSFELYPSLEAESGQSCGFHYTGGLTLARTRERLEELTVHKAKTLRLGLQAEFLTREEALDKAPILALDQVEGVLWEPSRGHVDPSGVTHAFARAARNLGAVIHRQCPVVETNPLPDGGWEVVTGQGTCRAEHVVNAAGLWAREVAALAGIFLPLMPVEHHYFVTENIPEIEAMDREVPSIGHADAGIYMRQEGQGLLMGAYEGKCTHWSETGTPQDFGHELLPNDLDRMEHNLAQMVEVVPVLGRAGIKRVVNGPMIFSPDLNPLVGPYPGRRNYWCACGVMTAFSQAAAVGKVLRDWIIEGDPGFDFFMWDVTRFGEWAGSAYAKAKSADMYTTRTLPMYPYEERGAGRPARTTPIYPLLREAGAVFGASYGWEVPLWYAPPGMPAKDELTFRRPNWLAPVGDEVRATHEGVGLFEVSAYAKYSVEGPAAASWLDRVLANRLPARAGRIVLSPMLNRAGRIAGDFTVTRLGDESFLLVGSGVVERFHERWWERESPPGEGVRFTSLSARLCGFAVAGPNARTLLSRLTRADLSNEALPYLHGLRCELGPVRDVIVLRVSYTGELGYEIYFPAEFQVALFEQLRAAGEDLELRLAGGRALGTMRIEKGFAAWGRELSPDYHPYESGMGRFVKLDKADFVGRDAALRLAQQPLAHRLCALEVDADGADAWGGEPVIAGGEFVGFVTSGGYGHRVGKSLALAYVSDEALEARSDLAVEIIGDARPAVRVAGNAAFDPKGERMRE